MQEPGVQPIKTVLQKRSVMYDPIVDDKGVVQHIPQGWEIVREGDFCFKCSAEWGAACLS